ncbi:MAG: outer membrane lipoprotein-sorting protein, partial [Bacteroidetes bacterium]
MKKEFYDEDEELLKVLKIKKVEKIEGFWVITRSEMKNVQKNHKTTIQLSDIKINTGVPASKFTDRMMMRGI